MPKESLFPPDEPHGFQVWHKQGRHYEHVATVESNALGAILMTSHGFMGYARWQDNPAVAAMPGDHRSTTIGDVLIGPDGRSLELSADDGLSLKPIAPVDRMPSDAKGTRPGREETPLERVERHIGHIKIRPNPHDFSIEELGPWDTGVSDEWKRLPEVEKLSSLVSQVDWRDISPEVKVRLLERELDFARVPEQARQTLLGEAAGVASARESDPAPCAPSLPQGAELRVLPGRGNPVYWRERTFDIHDATGKIGHLAGYLGGPWSEAEFRLTHVELSEPGRHLTPGQWKDVLRGLAEQLPDAGYLGANRTGVNGDLSPAYEKLIRMPHPASGVAKDLPAPAAMEGGFDRAGGMEVPGSEAGHADTGAEKRRLPSPSQIIADPADYLPQPQPGKDNEIER